MSDKPIKPDEAIEASAASGRVRRPQSRPPSAARPAPARRWSLIVAVAAVIAVVLALLVPVYALGRTERRVASCFAAAEAGSRDDPLSCVPGEDELAWVLPIPWLEADASQLLEDAEERALRLDYQQATAIAPSERARATAAARLLDRDARRGLAPPLAALVEQLPGAFEAVARAGMSSGDKEVRARALQTARVLADREALVVLSRGGDVTDPFRLNLERGATLCLQSMQGEGIAALLHADRGYRIASPQGDGYAFARLAMLACGQRKPSGELDPRHVAPAQRAALLGLEAALAAEGGVDLARVMLLDASTSLSASERLRLAAQVVHSLRPEPLAALAMLAPRQGAAAALDSDAFTNPWTLFDTEVQRHGLLVEPRAARGAAAHLRELADTLEDGPLSCAGQECPADVALAMPRQTLREVARMLWLEASREEWLRGHRELARKDARAALELSATSRRHEVAALLLAAGDAKGALATLDKQLSMYEARQSAGAAAVARLIEAQAQAHLGRMPEAMVAAEKALVRPSADPREPKPPAQLRAAAAWLWAAAGLASERGHEVADGLRPLIEQDDELAVVLTWLEIAAQPEESRRLSRSSYRLASPGPAALVAALYVAGHAVSAAQSEVWLDRLFDEEHRADPVRMMLARAEAARWRSDRQAEASWRDRAARLAEHVDSYEHALLASFARQR